MTEQQAPPSLRFCRWTLAGLRAAALVVLVSPLAAWCSPLLGLPALAPVFADLAWPSRLAGVLASLPAMLVWLAVIWRWSTVFRRFADGAFLQEDIARHIRIAGILKILAVPARVLTTALSGLVISLAVQGQRSLQLSLGSTEVFILLTGLICIALGGVWSEAARVHDEWQHTV